MYWNMPQRSFFGRIQDAIICFWDLLTTSFQTSKFLPFETEKVWKSEMFSSLKLSNFAGWKNSLKFLWRRYNSIPLCGTQLPILRCRPIASLIGTQKFMRDSVFFYLLTVNITVTNNSMICLHVFFIEYDNSIGFFLF